MQWEGEELFFTPRLTRTAPNDANVFSSSLLSFPSTSSPSRALLFAVYTNVEMRLSETMDQASKESHILIVANPLGAGISASNLPVANSEGET